MPSLVDLAAKRLGGMVVAASDEFFAPADRLLDPGPPVFDPHRYTDRGKEMDGWESRRRRAGDRDWCVVRLGVPGLVREVEVDTTHFRGNFPQACSLEGCVAGPLASPEELAEAAWFALLPRSPLKGDARNEFGVDDGRRVTHVRLVIYPDGGVARLRVRGEAVCDLRRLAGPGGVLDLAALASGGAAVAASEEFYAPAANLLLPGDSRDMGDGWETARRRGEGHDWAIVRLATAAHVERLEVDTTNFKGNHPAACAVDAADVGDGEDPAAAAWREIVGRTPLGPHLVHRLDVADADPATHLRLRIYPDGGLARLRALGRPTDEGWRQAGVRLLDAQLPDEAAAELAACCAARRWVERIVAGRPYAGFDALLDAADRVWADLGPDDWREAFAAHPKIGERAGSAWSQREQAGVDGAGEDTLAALAEGNRAYEERFGHVFLISAAGKTAEEMLAALRERMGNDPDTELRAAAEQQRLITRLRLERMVRP